LLSCSSAAPSQDQHFYPETIQIAFQSFPIPIQQELLSISRLLTVKVEGADTEEEAMEAGMAMEEMEALAAQEAMAVL
jgi:hypothetical protein